jgi:hypothetical protein
MLDSALESTKTKVFAPLNLTSGRSAPSGKDGGENINVTGAIFSGSTAGGEEGLEIESLLNFR